MEVLFSISEFSILESNILLSIAIITIASIVLLNMMDKNIPDLFRPKMWLNEIMEIIMIIKLNMRNIRVYVLFSRPKNT